MHPMHSSDEVELKMAVEPECREEPSLPPLDIGVDKFEWTVTVLEEVVNEDCLAAEGDAHGGGEGGASAGSRGVVDSRESTNDEGSDTTSDSSSEEEVVEDLSVIRVQALDRVMKRKWKSDLDKKELEKAGFDPRLPVDKKVRLIEMALLGLREVSVSDVKGTGTVEGEGGDGAAVVAHRSPSIRARGGRGEGEERSRSVSLAPGSSSSLEQNAGIRTSVFYAKRCDKPKDRFLKLKRQSTDYRKKRWLTVQIEVSQFSFPHMFCLEEVTQSAMDILTARFEDLVADHCESKLLLQVALSGVLPKGSILMWSGKVEDIPIGFALCDGSGDAPDLRERFLSSAGECDLAAKSASSIPKEWLRGDVKGTGKTVTAMRRAASASAGDCKIEAEPSPETEYRLCYICKM